MNEIDLSKGTVIEESGCKLNSLYNTVLEPSLAYG
jgi:hypothetical protein